ncbi:MAG: AAA family ATPase [Pseudanabaena sp.]
MTEETSTTQVPLLDLAPKLKRPLSLWNPLDYFLLLYWAFYFPQAIPWYEENFCEYKTKFNLLDWKRMNWQQRLEFLRIRLHETQLLIMSVILALGIPTLIYVWQEKSGIQNNWIALSFCIVLTLLSALSGSGKSKFIRSGVLWSFVCFVISPVSTAGWGFGLFIAIVFGTIEVIEVGRSPAGGFILMFLFGFSSSVYIAQNNIFGGLIGFVSCIAVIFLFGSNSVYGQGGGMGLLLSMNIWTFVLSLLGFWFAFKDHVIGILAATLVTAIVSLVGIFLGLRLDDRLISSKSIPRVTPLHMPRFSHQISSWLELDWHRGLMNINQILRYSQQHTSVYFALNRTLGNTSYPILLERIATLSDHIWNWKILFYCSASLESTLKWDFLFSVYWLPYNFKLWIAKLWDVSYEELRNDIVYRTVAEGFWYLYKSSNNQNEPYISYLSKSIEVFSQTRDIEHGEEMYQLVCILHDFTQPQTIQDLFDINQPILPASQKLRPKTWFMLSKLADIVKDVHNVGYNKSINSRSKSLNRALGNINKLFNELESLPDEVSRVERPIIYKIATLWRDLLLSFTSEIGGFEISEPIPNPYTIGDPVIGDRFIGREDILRQLEELWFINTSPQSVILYGHRRMGKTSILRNATTKVNTEVRVAYVNLLSVSSANNGITDILMAICDALEEVTEIPVPSNNDLHQFPETTFRRYLEQITKTFTGKGLIIALDEFEKIEELIDAGKLSKDFLGFLRGMVQMSSKLAFAFAGLHTLQEMNADYFQPFYASFIPISVAFLTREATHQVLANPDPEFLLEYEPAALDHIYDLTNGQPYLTQLIGFQLVRMFNDYVFEQGKPRDRTFTIDDVRTICSGENFFNTGINYFNGVWQQAAEGAAHQQDILKALAPHPQGLTESELISQTNLPSATLQAALKTLKDHDVIRSQKTNEIVNWAMAVELFRTWVVKYKLSDT